MAYSNSIAQSYLKGLSQDAYTPSFYCNRNFISVVCKSSPLSQKNSVHKFISNLFMIHLTLNYYLYLGFPSYIFPLYFKIKISMPFLPTCMLQVLSISAFLTYITLILDEKAHYIFLNTLSLCHRYCVVHFLLSCSLEN